MVAVIVEHGSPQILRRHRLEEIFNCLHIVALQNKIGAGGHEDDADLIAHFAQPGSQPHSAVAFAHQDVKQHKMYLIL